jgi:hypothetical protein
MEIDTRFPTELDSISDAPDPLRSALMKSLPSEDPVCLLVYAPAFSGTAENTPATLLAVTKHGWFVASETEEGGATVEKSDFTGTLFLELTSVLLSGQLKIHFATRGTSDFATINFETLGEEFYREAIYLILAGIDPMLANAAEKDRKETSMFEAWPKNFRFEAERYWPKGQRLVTAIQWPAIFGGFHRELAPAGALLVTARELVLISEEKSSPRQHTGDLHEFGGIITFFPRVRLANFHVSHHERFGVFALQMHAEHGGEKLEIIFPSEDEMIVSKAMEQVSAAALPAAAASAAAPRAPAATPPATALTLEQIQLRAYFISERRRKLGIAGDAHQDWITAEQELRAELTT